MDMLCPDKHPLKEDFTSDNCHICGYSIYDFAYVCAAGCKFHVHKLCAEAPPKIHRHPFHPQHDLSHVRDRKYGIFKCDDGCDFSLDVDIALSTLPDHPNDDDDGSPSHQITVRFHSHELTLFSAKWEIGFHCSLCQGRIQGDGYVCSRLDCRFLIHRRCTEDRYYEDGTKVPRVYHVHGLGISSKGVGSSIRCWECESEISGDYLGCEECGCFYHRSCVQLPEVFRFPTHPNHAIVLFIETHRYSPVKCQSCSLSTRDCLSYRCIDCNFALHAACALRILSYCEEGASAEVTVPWHEHPLLLCHRTDDVATHCCSGCGDYVKGLTYRCKERDCEVLLDKACAELRSKIDNHPHHPYPEHPLVLLMSVYGSVSRRCDACHERIFGLSFTCEPCDFSLDVKCASRVPTRKNHLHEHNLARFDAVPSLECNRCGAGTDSPLFRCVPCDFNLHEKCMEVPRTAKHKTHEHELKLWDSYTEEDDSGEYYCDICEQLRDARLGVYVCEICKWSILFRAHIECVLPELRKVYAKKGPNLLAKRLDEEVMLREEEVCELEEKLEEAKAKLDKARKEREELTLLMAKGEE